MLVVAMGCGMRVLELLLYGELFVLLQIGIIVETFDKIYRR